MEGVWLGIGTGTGIGKVFRGRAGVMGGFGAGWDGFRERRQDVCRVRDRAFVKDRDRIDSTRASKGGVGLVRGVLMMDEFISVGSMLTG